jgi:hypothetical protein
MPFASIVRKIALLAAPKYRRGHPEQQTDGFAQELEEEKSRKNLVKRMIRFSASGVLALLALVFVRDGIKLIVIQGVWHVLQIAAFAAGGVSAIISGHYARERRWKRFALAVLAILLAAAAFEHFLHQVINTGRITCPNCEDEDDPNSDV